VTQVSPVVKVEVGSEKVRGRILFSRREWDKEECCRRGDAPIADEEWRRSLVWGTGVSHRVKVQNPGSYMGMVRSLAGCFQGPQAERGGA
jgi:hypothetical protein